MRLITKRGDGCSEGLNWCVKSRFREIAICNDMETRGDIYAGFDQYGIDLFGQEADIFIIPPYIHHRLMDVVSGGYAREDVLRPRPPIRPSKKK